MIAGPKLQKSVSTDNPDDRNVFNLDPFFTSAPAGLAILDSHLRILKINEGMAEIIGDTVASILGKTPGEVVPHLSPMIEPILLQVVSTGRPALNFPVVGETPKAPGVLRNWIASVFPMNLEESGSHAIGAIAVEVTDKAHLDRLKKSEALLAHAEAIADLGSWEHDCLTGEEVLSTNLRRMLGRDINEKTVPEAFFWDSMHPDDRDTVRQVIEWGMKDRQPYEFRSRFLFPDGRYHVLLTRGRFEVDATNRVTKRLGVTQDITRQVEIERQLLSSEERYRDLVENNTDLICTHDLDGQILSLNERPAQMLGVRPEDLIGRRIPDFLFPEYRHEFAEYIDTIRRQGHAEGIMAVPARAGGRRFWEYRNTLRTEGVPAPIVRGTARDITERKFAQEALRDSEALANRHLKELQLIYSTAPVGLCFLDLELRFMRINDFLASVTERPVDDHLGRSVREVWPLLADQLEPVYAQILDGGEPIRNVEFSGSPRTGSSQKRIWELSIFPLTVDDGSVLGCNVVVQDVTEKRETEKILRHLSTRLMHLQDEERHRIAVELHETVAQDLAALKMMLQIVKRRSSKLPARTRKQMEECLEMSDRAVRQIRTLSYLLYPPLLKERDFSSTIAWYAAGFSRRSGIRVELDLPDEDSPLPLEYKIGLFRVLQESLTNVHRHSRSRSVRISFSRKGDEISLEIRDHGDGLPVAPASNLDYMTGVGIAAMHERIRQLDGVLQIVTVPKEGVTVRVNLVIPHSQAKDAQDRSDRQDAPRHMPGSASNPSPSAESRDLSSC